VNTDLASLGEGLPGFRIQESLLGSFLAGGVIGGWRLIGRVQLVRRGGVGGGMRILSKLPSSKTDAVTRISGNSRL
jgi:hypothetical protein